MQPASVLTQLVTFTLIVIDEPHWEVKVTLNGPRKVFFEVIEKFEPEETLWEPGETVRLEGKVATTRVGLLMLTRTLPVVPPFFLIVTVVELTWMLQEGGPESAPMPPPDRSMQGVLSVVPAPPTTARLLIPSDEFKLLL
jgi:hypothetical protein